MPSDDAPRGGAADKVVRTLAAKGLVEQIDADAPADSSLAGIDGGTR